MDYERIGMRIRQFRQKKGLSQEQLSEIVNISVTHMSHIETGNTKLSLPVFISISEALNIRCDELLHDPPSDNDLIMKELAGLIECCSPQQARCIADIAKAAKTAFDLNLV